MTVPNKLTRGLVITEELKAEIERRYNEFDSLRQQRDKFKDVSEMSPDDLMRLNPCLNQCVSFLIEACKTSCQGSVALSLWDKYRGTHNVGEAMQALTDTKEE